MKWAHFNYQGQPRYGLLNGTTIQLTDHTWSDILTGKPAHLEGEIAQDQVTLLCSQAFTLEPGDVLLTGTPHGVGLGRDPQIYMQDGDVIVVEIEGIGRLENRCQVI